MFKKFPYFKQHDEKDCGPACLRIISKYYGKALSTEFLQELSNTGRAGTSLLSLSQAAEELGYEATGAQLGFEDITAANAIPCIAFWKQVHYVVVYKITATKVYVSDPAIGLVNYSITEFKNNWHLTGTETGIIMALEPTAAFETNKSFISTKANAFPFILSYIRQYKRLLVQLLAGLVIASVLQLIFPFLTQSIVDTGIVNKDVPFIYLILFSQLLVFLGKTSVEMVRSYILLHLSNRINISLLSDFFIKLMKLPLGFFDRKMVGDIFQRIYDHQRVETFLTSGTLNFTFSSISLLVFSGVLLHYSTLIFGVFAGGGACYFLWVQSFMKRRAKLDNERFGHLKNNQDKNFEMIFGMQEIKLHNAERKKRWQWEEVQSKMFTTNIQSLSLKQWQTGGATVINELKNIIISFLCAMLVIKGSLSLGMMLAVSYIVGQLNAPITQMLEFIQSLQDAKLSLERISEIHNKEEEDAGQELVVDSIPKGNILFENLSFSYGKMTEGTEVLKNLNLTIPRNKITAIVGSSGSGKTTLLKLLLKFYQPGAGSISINNTPLNQVNSNSWRNSCGVVMQEGFIFDDTIINNIAVGDENPNMQRIREAVHIANIQEFVEGLPMGYHTKIGANGLSPSTGQKQRILIARAVYKNPEVIIFDEATSALDARNERIIVENLDRFFKGKTVIIIAHRLSTVKNADQIVVLDKGSVTEVGNHSELVTERGFYFNLVKNQLELGV